MFMQSEAGISHIWFHLALSLGPVSETKSNKGLGIELKCYLILDPDEAWLCKLTDRAMSNDWPNLIRNTLIDSRLPELAGWDCQCLLLQRYTLCTENVPGSNPAS